MWDWRAPLYGSPRINLFYVFEQSWALLRRRVWIEDECTTMHRICNPLGAIVSTCVYMLGELRYAGFVGRQRLPWAERVFRREWIVVCRLEETKDDAGQWASARAMGKSITKLLSLTVYCLRTMPCVARRTVAKVHMGPSLMTRHALNMRT